MMVVEGGGGLVEVLNVFRRGDYQNWTSANKGGGKGSKFYSFCENVIIKWPQMKPVSPTAFFLDVILNFLDVYP